MTPGQTSEPGAVAAHSGLVSGDESNVAAIAPGVNASASLPFSEDGEKGVLCSLLLNPLGVINAIDRRSGGFNKEAFYIPANQIIYETVIGLLDAGTAVDFITLKQVLKDAGQLEEIGGPEYVDELYSFVPTAANLNYYLEIVEEKWNARDLALILQNAINKCYSQPGQNEALIAEVESSIRGLADRTSIACKEEVFTIDQLLEFNRDKDLNCVFGRRWICRVDSLLISGPTGIGKSSFAMQAVVNWCLGKDLFGIKTHFPQRVLVIQSENNLGDLAIALQDVCDRLQLSDADKAALKDRLVFIRESERTGAAFIQWLRGIIRRYKPDIILIDPLLSYIGGDINRQEVVSGFLRNGLQPILNETGVICVLIHHTGKPPRDAKAKPAGGNAYLALGSSEIQNWSREIITFMVRDWERRIFDLEFRKRARQAGIRTPDDQPAYQLTLRHSELGVVWEPCSAAEIADSEPETKTGSNKRYTVNQLVAILGRDELSHGEFRTRAMDVAGMSKPTFDRLLKQAKRENRIHLCAVDQKYEVVSTVSTVSNDTN